MLNAATPSDGADGQMDVGERGTAANVFETAL